MPKGKTVIISLIVFSLFASVSINQYVHAQILSLDSTSTDLSINPTSVNIEEEATVTATVSDTTISINTPGGTVTFGDDGAGGTFGIVSCTTSNNMLVCTVTYIAPNTAGTVTITGIYSGDLTHKSSSDAASLSVIGTVSEAPIGLRASAVSTTQIDLRWDAPTNDGGSAITGYQIERSTDDGATWSIIISNTNSTATIYSDTGLSENSIYTYRVSAINSVGVSSPSNVASADTGSPSTAPEPPTNLLATAVSSSQIDLSWDAPTNDGGSAITGYQIERSTDDGLTWITLISNTDSTATTYSDAGLEASTAYSYRVSTINSVGTSLPSDVATATTNIQFTGITVYAHRIPADYWDPCFAAECSAGTGPGTTMHFALYDSSGNFLRDGFADEFGYTFSGLNPNDSYYVYPTDCGYCHFSFHDVVFEYWGDNFSNERPRATMVGSNLHAWYSCTNGCA